jgi:hypothetical protein
MKITLIVMLTLALVATTLYASLIQPPYDKSKLPGMSLPVAYDHAITALDSDTNQFHCVSATIATEFSDDGWYFTFCSTNSKVLPKLIVVEFNGKGFLMVVNAEWSSQFECSTNLQKITCATLGLVNKHRAIVASPTIHFI